MDIILETLHFKASDDLEQLAHEKVGKLSGFNEQIIRANVTLYEGASGSVNNQWCEIRLEIPGNDLFVKKSADRYEQSITDSVEALQKLIRKDKTKKIDRRRHNNQTDELTE